MTAGRSAACADIACAGRGSEHSIDAIGLANASWRGFLVGESAYKFVGGFAATHGLSIPS
jgi:hypothetical protein